MDHAGALAYFDDHIGSGVRPGLERIAEMVELMADPQEAYPIIHIAGTNGKTSTTYLASAIIAAHGLKVGSFTSPHLQRIEERFLINGEPISDDRLVEAVEDVAPFADLLEHRTGQRPTYFELTAAVALSLFAAEAVDAAVIEVGMGGRWDATNVVQADVAVVTGIGLDHTAILGSTIPEIAAEKLAIVKEGSSLVVGRWPDEASDAPSIRARETGATLLAHGRDFSVEAAVPAVGGWSVDLKGVYRDYPDVFLSLHGRHQVDNFAVAAASVEALLGRELAHDAVQQAAATIVVPGRVEVVGAGPLVIIDGAHNPGGVHALAGALTTEFPHQPWVIVMGVMEDKDVVSMLTALKPLAAQIIAVPVDSPRALAPETLEERASALGMPASSAASVDDGIQEALAAAGREGSVAVVGSLYLAGEARTLLV